MLALLSVAALVLPLFRRRNRNLNINLIPVYSRPLSAGGTMELVRIPTIWHASTSMNEIVNGVNGLSTIHAPLPEYLAGTPTGDAADEHKPLLPNNPQVPSSLPKQIMRIHFIWCLPYVIIGPIFASAFIFILLRVILVDKPWLPHAMAMIARFLSPMLTSPHLVGSR